LDQHYHSQLPYLATQYVYKLYSEKSVIVIVVVVVDDGGGGGGGGGVNV